MTLICTGIKPADKPTSQIGFLWLSNEIVERWSIPMLRMIIPEGELEGFDSDLALVGRVYVVPHDDGSRHHFPILQFMEPMGRA